MLPRNSVQLMSRSSAKKGAKASKGQPCTPNIALGLLFQEICPKNDALSSQVGII